MDHVLVSSSTPQLSAHFLLSRGDFEIVDFQRLNASGYVFSASLPPFLAATALKSLEILSSAEVGELSRLSFYRLYNFVVELES